MVGNGGESAETVAATAAPTPPNTRAGGQDDGSYTNSLKQAAAEDNTEKQKQMRVQFTAIIIAGSRESRRKYRSRGRSRGKET